MQPLSRKMEMRGNLKSCNRWQALDNSMFDNLTSAGNMFSVPDGGKRAIQTSGISCKVI